MDWYNTVMAEAQAEPETRRRLIDTAARLLAEEGPAALSTRRLAREVGTSTMAVYTYFGGLPALVEAVAAEGFARLAEHLTAVIASADSLADLAQLAVAYRDNARENPHLYAVVFGTASLGGYRRGEPGAGRETFDVLVDGVRRVHEAGLLETEDPESTAAQLWSALHGFVTLELAGFFDETAVDGVMWPMLARLIVDSGRA